jgi:hypothetical protein
MKLNESRNFIIKDIDDTHVLINGDHLEYIKEQVDVILERNVWVATVDH